MNKPTLLEIVQDILASISGDEVNSIFDTVESEQVARIVKNCYEVTTNTQDFPEKYGLFSLESSGNSSKPTLMTMPSTADSLQWFKYDCRRHGETSSLWTDLKYLPLEDFLQMMYMGQMDNNNMAAFSTQINNAVVEVRYFTDRAPSYYTSYDDNNVLVDSCDFEIETTIQKVKTLCYGKLAGGFNLSDTYVVDLDPNAIVLLKQEAKATAWNELKLTENVRAERDVSRLRTKLSKDKLNINPAPKYPGYGRRGMKYGR